MTLRFSRVGVSESMLLARNLAITLSAGVSLGRALTLFEEETPKRQRKLITHLRTCVNQGHSLADAMESSPRSFLPIVIHLVRTGEQSGTLEQNLRDVVTHLRRMQDLQRKIRSAMLYPVFVLVAVLGLGLSIGVFVLPKLIPLFGTLDVELPLMTLVLLAVARFFAAYGILFSVGMIVMTTGLSLLVRLQAVKPYWHRVLLTIPYVTHVIKYAMLAQLSRVFATLLNSGIPIKLALSATADATENRVYRGALRSALPVIGTGRHLAEALRAHRSLFPGVAVTLIEIGEETGTLSQTLNELADHYENEVDYALKNLTTALEPILLIGVGIVVGSIVLAIITPIYQITGSIR